MKRLVLAVLCLFIATEVLTKPPARAKYGLPAGAWSVGCGPRLKPGPIVDLYKTGSSVLTGITVTDLWLENRSKQNVAGVKIAWRLYETSNKETTLLKGESPKFLAVPLTAGEKRLVNYPVVSFAKIYRPLLRGRNTLTGDYRIELWVSDVKFAPEAVEQGPTALLNVKRVNWSPDAELTFVAVKSEPTRIDDELGCQKQTCSWDNQNSCYRCISLDGSTCKWFNCTYCESGRCRGYLD